jgi:putative membrane protein
MRWWDGHMTGWGWFWMTIVMVAFWALVAWAVVAGIGGTRGADRETRATPPRPPEDILAERFARGEIDEETYRRSLKALRDARDDARL